MGLVLIFGPMKSGKSFDLISYFAPLKYTEIPFGLFQPLKNKRDKNICSRDGIWIKAKKIKNLCEIPDKGLDMVGIDEIHMFPENGVEKIERLLKGGGRVVVSGLDKNYQGKMFGIVKRLFEFGPEEVRYKRAVCEICKKPEAVYTQIYDGEKPVLGKIGGNIIDDGSYIFKPVCRNCFIKSQE